MVMLGILLGRSHNECHRKNFWVEREIDQPLLPFPRYSAHALPTLFLPLSIHRPSSFPCLSQAISSFPTVQLVPPKLRTVFSWALIPIRIKERCGAEANFGHSLYFLVWILGYSPTLHRRLFPPLNRGVTWKEGFLRSSESIIFFVSASCTFSRKLSVVPAETWR